MARGLPFKSPVDSYEHFVNLSSPSQELTIVDSRPAETGYRIGLMSGKFARQTTRSDLMRFLAEPVTVIVCSALCRRV